MIRLLDLPVEILRLIVEHDAESIFSLLLTCKEIHNKLADFRWIADVLINQWSAAGLTSSEIRQQFWNRHLCRGDVLLQLNERVTAAFRSKYHLRELVEHGFLHQAAWVHFQLRRGANFTLIDRYILEVILEECDTPQKANEFMYIILQFKDINARAVMRTLLHRPISHAMIEYIMRAQQLEIEVSKLHLYFTRDPPGLDMLTLLKRLVPNEHHDELIVKLLGVNPRDGASASDPLFIRALLHDLPQILNDPLLFRKLVKRIEVSYRDTALTIRQDLFTQCFRGVDLPVGSLPLVDRVKLANIFVDIHGAQDTTQQWTQ
jgi:hypothetical protein